MVRRTNRWSCLTTRGNNVAAGLLAAWLLTLPAPAWAGNAEADTRPLAAFEISPPRRQPVLGERLAFQGRWLGLPVGSGWIEVKEIVELEGHRAYHIEAQASSNDLLSVFYPIHDTVHSYLDADTLQPLRFEKDQQEGTYRAREVVVFDAPQRRATYHSLVNNSTKTIELPEQFQDLISALYWFRSQPLDAVDQLRVNLYTDEKIYQTRIIIRPPLHLELLKRGTFPCLVAEPEASFKGLLVRRGRIWAYLTTDTYRLPLLVRATTPWGQMSAVLDASSIPPDIIRLAQSLE